MPSSMRWGAPPPPSGGGWGGGFRGGYRVFGLYILKPIAWLMGAILLASIGSALVPPMMRYLPLEVGHVWQGQAWRLLSWSLLEFNPLGLIFELLMLYFFSPDLISRWGVRGFLIRFFACGALVGVLTCLALRPFTGELGEILAHVPYTGLMAISEAMIIAWGALMPDRQILVMFMIPMSGRNLIWASIAITFVFAALGGLILAIPVFIAEAVALVYMDVFSLRRLYLRGRMAMLEREYKRRTGHLHVVDRDRDEPPRWTH